MRINNKLTSKLIAPLVITIGLFLFAPNVFAQDGCWTDHHLCWYDVGMPDSMSGNHPGGCVDFGSYSGHMPGGSPDYCGGCGTSGACWWIDYHDHSATCSNCAHGGPGGPGPSPRQVIGRIYDNELGYTRIWQRADSTCGPYETDLTNTMTVENDAGANSSWTCNATPPSPHYTRSASGTGEGPYEFTFTPPPGWECDTWFVVYPYGVFPDDTGVGCSASVMLGSSPWDNHLWFKIKPIQADDPLGFFDNAGCTNFVGWAGDQNDPTQPVRVDFYADGPAGTGTFAGSVIADSTREANVCTSVGGVNCDTLCPPLGPGTDPQCKHGFSYPTPSFLQDGTFHDIYAYAINLGGTPGNNRQLGNSPLPMNCSFPEQPVQGYLWDATGLACTADEASNKLTSSDITGDIDVTIPSVGTIPWDPSNSGYSYRFDSVEFDPNSPSTGICTTNFLPDGLTNFRYNLECIEGNNATITTPLCGIFDMQDVDPNTLHMGFRLDSTGWFKSIGGDVYGGYSDGSGINPSISVGIPDETAVVGTGMTAYLVDNGSVFGNEALSVKDPSGTNKYSQPVSRAASLLGATDTWPESYNYIVPNNPHVIDLDTYACTTIFTSGTLDPEYVYTGEASCLNEAIDAVSAATYSTASAGVVVIYVEDDTNDLVFNGSFVPANLANKVLFVSESPVFISRSIGTDVLPLDSVSPQIYAGIIAKAGITFEGTSDPAAFPDNTIITQGPLIVGGGSPSDTIHFNRDRGLTNEAPAEIIYYNIDFLNQLTQTERNSTTLNHTGLFNVDVTWEVIE